MSIIPEQATLERWFAKGVVICGLLIMAGIMGLGVLAMAKGLAYLYALPITEW